MSKEIYFVVTNVYEGFAPEGITALRWLQESNMKFYLSYYEAYQYLEAQKKENPAEEKYEKAKICSIRLSIEVLDPISPEKRFS